MVNTINQHDVIVIYKTLYPAITEYMEYIQVHTMGHETVSISVPNGNYTQHDFGPQKS